MRIKRGDIVWLNEELEINLGKNVQSISRPYVVISNNLNNKLCPTVNVACLTTQDSKARYPMHVLLDKSKYGFKHNSVIYTEQVLTVNKHEIRSIISTLDKEDLEKLNQAIYIQLINEKGMKKELKKYESKNNSTHGESRISSCNCS